MEKQQLKQTKNDSLVTNRTMQLVKAVIPYINNDAGTLIGMLIKFQELQNAARINNNVAIAAMNADKHKGMELSLIHIYLLVIIKRKRHLLKMCKYFCSHIIFNSCSHNMSVI